MKFWVKFGLSQKYFWRASSVPSEGKFGGVSERSLLAAASRVGWGVRCGGGFS